MGILDKAQHYPSRYYNGEILEPVPDDCDMIRADDPVLAALVEYYEASEAYEIVAHPDYEAEPEDAYEQIEIAAFDRFIAARAAITKLRDGQ